VIVTTAQKIEERLDYGMLDYPGLANLGMQKQYVSLYILPAVLAKYRDEFAGVDRGKSCLRFKRADQVNAKALKRPLRDVLKARKEKK
jgi:hypothetical protein